MHTAARAALTALVLAAPALAQSPLDDLSLTRPAVSARVSSASPDANSNADNRWVKAGETFTMADIIGPGVIRHIWLTFGEPGPSWLSKDGAADPSEIVLRMYWDGAAQPAVEAPLGDFFAAGFGRRAEIVSLPVIVQGGDSYNCFWPMPFFKSAKITVTNESDKVLAALYFQIDYTKEPSLPDNTAYFCAQYRQEFPTKLGADYLIADIEVPPPPPPPPPVAGINAPPPAPPMGGGHYVGTVMSVRARSPQWFGEGDEKFYIDGGEGGRPTMQGTGTEDYFLNAWGMQKGSYPYFGVTQLDGWLGDLGQTGTMYRWHLADPVRFTKSLRLTIEHAGWMSADETTTGKVEGFVEREDDFATVAFWYQHGQPKRFATLPSAKDRRLPSIDTIIEGKDLLAKAKSEGGGLSLQAGSPWTGAGQLFFDAGAQGAWLEFTFDVPAADAGVPRRLIVPLTHSYDFGSYWMLLDGAPTGEQIDLYNPTVELHERDLGDRTLGTGSHTIRLECQGKNAGSQGFKLGIDSVRLRHRTGAKRPPLGK